MSETEDLREAIARALAANHFWTPDGGRIDWERMADAVLALPQVAELRGKVERVEALADLARRAVEQTKTICRCPDEPHQNLLHDLAHDLDAALHACATCTDCLHDGHRCCGYYDGSCCRAALASDPTTHESEGA